MERRCWYLRYLSLEIPIDFLLPDWMHFPFLLQHHHVGASYLSTVRGLEHSCFANQNAFLFPCTRINKDALRTIISRMVSGDQAPQLDID